jgi:4-amino-4-deoxy-L-arabinose transferase-like glycosyltransferase
MPRREKTTGTSSKKRAAKRLSIAGFGVNARVQRWKVSLNTFPELYLLLIVFAVAIAVRLVYLGQLNDAPFFEHPVGDSKIYHQRAVDIVAGDFIGKEAYFHSSPFYPYFMALVYKLFGVNFTILRLIQFLIGSLTCVLIYLLAKRIAAPRKGPALIAGLVASVYGTLVFFDGDLLMIPLVLFFTSASVLLLTYLTDPSRAEVDSAGRRQPRAEVDGAGRRQPRAEVDSAGRRQPRRLKTLIIALTSGVLLGFAGLGKPNVLLFAPIGIVWVLSEFKRSFSRRRWREAALYTLGCILAVMPITIRNYAVSHDFVLVSSNAGVNFYIGNNEVAEGIFFLPPGSGLDNTKLYLSSRAAAETATGKQNIKPSMVSAYWTRKTLDYMKQNTGDAAALLIRKFRLFWNHYEIPNHHNKYFISRAYAPFLGVLPTGYGLVAPLAVVGLLFMLLSRPVAPVARLYVGFLLVYMGSLIPFFITARYRLPVVPFLAVFASLGVWGFVDSLQKRHWRRVGGAAAAGLITGIFVWWPTVNYDFGFNHTVMGTVYSDLATEEPENAVDHIKNAIVEYKTALELRPLSVDAHYNLGVTYQRIGFFAGAVEELKAAVALQPTHSYASKALSEASASLARKGDTIEAVAVPRTPFETAVDYTNRGVTTEAVAMYERVLQKDPHHAGAHSQLGAISFDRGDFKAAIGQFKKGLRHKPDHFVLNNNIAGAYYKIGNRAKARQHWERCLKIDPQNENVRRQLRLIGR